MNESFKLVKSETIPLTLELAEEHRALTAPPTERPLKEERVKFLRERAEAGYFLPPSWSSATVGNKPPKVRANGNHSSTALCRLKENFPNGLLVHYDHYQVKDQNGLVLLFRQLDNRISNRTRSDVAGAFQGGAALTNPNLAGLKKRFAMLSVEGIAWHRRFLEGAPVPSGDGVYAIFQEENEHPFIEWNNGILTVKFPELCNKAITAAMYEGYTDYPAEADKFWTLVVQGGVFDNPNHPATKLADWLKELKEKKVIPKPGSLYNGCMYAWNAYLQGKSIPGIVKSDPRRSLYRNI